MILFGFFYFSTILTNPIIMLLSYFICSNYGHRILIPSLSINLCATKGCLMCFMARSKLALYVLSVSNHYQSTYRLCLDFLLFLRSLIKATITQNTECLFFLFLISFSSIYNLYNLQNYSIIKPFFILDQLRIIERKQNHI